MDTKLLSVALAALIIGAGGGYYIADSKESEALTMQDGSSVHGGMHEEMSSMMMGLDGKTGDEFDKAFLSEMIVHHEGAVEMAQAALVSARHDEIKQMANEIISAQTREIQQMKDWQKSWYGQ